MASARGSGVYGQEPATAAEVISLVPFENASVEALRDARLFARWIQEGVMTVEQAREDILVSPRQLKVIRENHSANVLREVMQRRQGTWAALLRLLVAQRKRESVNASGQARSVSP